MIQATDPMRLLRILEHRARSPDIFFKDCRGIPRSTGFSTQKNIQKPAGLALANSICAICLQDASYSCEDKINMQLILTHAFCTERFQKGTEKRKECSDVKTYTLHTMAYNPPGFVFFKHAFSRRPSVVKQFQFLGSAPAMSLEDLEVQIPQVDQAGSLAID